MTVSDTKNIDFVNFLNKIGFTPAKFIKNFAWYLSPLHSEKTPSFKVDNFKNKYYDYAIGCNGDLINFVEKYFNVSTSEALRKIESTMNLISSTIQKPLQQPTEKQATVEINHIQTIQSKGLIQYLNERKISLEIASLYLNEAYYKINDKQYFALAFKNNKGGYELRNKFWKGGNSPKYYTTIYNQFSTGLNIFEGFFDFLTALQYYKLTVPNHTTIILNSLSFVDATLLLCSEYKQINLFLDNDNAGKLAVEKYKSIHKNVIDRAQQTYPKHKDFNEFLINK